MSAMKAATAVVAVKAPASVCTLAARLAADQAANPG
jgi:hypothetical protein